MFQLSHEKNPLNFHYFGCWIGILIMVYKNHHISGSYNPLYILNNKGFFHCSIDLDCCLAGLWAWRSPHLMAKSFDFIFQSQGRNHADFCWGFPNPKPLNPAKSWRQKMKFDEFFFLAFLCLWNLCPNKPPKRKDLADLTGKLPQTSPFDHSKREKMQCKCLDLSEFTCCFDQPCVGSPPFHWWQTS